MDCGSGVICLPPPPSPSPSARTLVNSKVMVVAVLVLFGVVLFILCLHIYAKWFWRTHGAAVTARNAEAVAAQQTTRVGAAATQSVGLERAVVEALPMFEYEAAKEPLECSVCLEDFEHGERGRTLPRCGHAFHLNCIDMWLHSHSTCPLCRLSAAPKEEEEEKAEAVVVDIPEQQPRPVVGDVGAPFMAAMRQHRRSRRVSANSLPRTAADAEDMDESAVQAVVLEQRLKEFETPTPLQVTIDVGGSSNNNVAAVLSPMARASASFRRLLSRDKTVVTPQDEADEDGPSSSPRAPPPPPPSV